jgi:hypothetical protein
LRWGKVDPTQRRSIRQMQPARMANDRTEESHIIEAEEYRSRWGARASKPMESVLFQQFTVEIMAKTRTTGQ